MNFMQNWGIPLATSWASYKFLTGTAALGGHLFGGGLGTGLASGMGAGSAATVGK